MAAFAMRLISLIDGAVRFFVESVFLVSPPPEVCHSIVRWVAVVVADFHPVRARAKKYLGYQSVNILQ